MIKIIAIFDTIKKHCICDNCKTVFEYQKEDIQLKEFESGCSSYFHSFLPCLQCKSMINVKIEN